MIKLFGYFINKDDLSDYVSLVRQALQECGTPGKSSAFVIGADSKIKDVNHFLRLLGDSVSGDTASKVYKHLSDFLLFVGLLSDIDISMLPTGVCGTNFNQNNNFHTTIEVWQNVLSTLVSLEERYPGHHLSIMQTLGGIDGYHHSTATIEICQVILWDLVLVAHSKYKVMKPGELLRSSPFCCACMKQMWKTIISHFDSSETHPFWFCLQQIWRISKQDVNSDIDIDSNMFLFPPSVEWKNEIKAEFWWWLTMNITDLYENDHQHQNAESSVSNLLLGLIQDVLPRDGCQVEQVSFAMKCMILIKQSKLTIKGDLITPFWERYFHKKLTEQQLTLSLGMKGLTNIPKSSSQWVQMWKDKLNKRVIGKDQIENESLFNQFLIMLGKMLPLAEKSIKGRIFSKFHERKMKSLTEVGFVNFTSLFMVMTLTGGTQTDTVNKLSDLYSMLSFTPKFLNTVIKGMLGILLIIHTSKIDNIEFTKEIGQTFGKVCTWFLESNNRNEPGVHHQLWTVMCTYMDGVQEILDLGPISAGVAPLIPGHMADALEGSSGNNEMIRILQFVQTVMHKVRNREEAINQLVSLDSYTEIARILWTSVFPFVKTHSTTLTPPEILADVATSFTLLAQDSPPPASSGIKENVSSLFNYFSINENVNGLFSCRYMCHLIPHGLLFPQNDTLLQAWIRCCLLIPDDSSEQFTELTRLIFTSGAMKDFVTSQVDPSPKVCFLHFLKSIQEGYENAVKEGLLHKTNYREKVFNLFSNMNKYVIPPLRTPSGSHICHVYTMCGHIISRCGSALYLQSRADSPLPPLIKSLILPRVIYDGNKVLHSALLAAMKDTIHMYVTGLASIKMDPYIERCIRDIFKHYMKRFPLRSSSGGGGSLHPLVNCLRLMPASVRKLIYETVLSNFTQPDSSTAWMFLSEAFVTNPPQVTSEDCKYVMNTLLYNYIVIKQQQIEEIMQKLLRVLHKNGTDLDKNQTADVMKEFIVQHFKAYSIRLLKVLDLLSNWCPSVLCLLIQTLTEVILYTETNRGIDTQLREKYYCILRKLGNEGQVEISRLTS